MKTLIIAILIILQIILGCCSNKPEKQLNITLQDTMQVSKDEIIVDSIKTQQTVGSTQKTVIKPNVTFVTAIIVSVFQLEENQYRLNVKLNTAIPDVGMESLIEPGQNLEVYPEYILSEGGKIDLSDERNIKLLQLRDAQSGDAFMGKISLNSSGKWVIISVEDIMTNR